MDTGSQNEADFKRSERIREAANIAGALRLDRNRENRFDGLTLLGLVNLLPALPWSEAQAPLRSVREILDFVNHVYDANLTPNSQESIRKVLASFLREGLVRFNPDDENRPANSPHSVYQIQPHALELARTYGTAKWFLTWEKYTARQNEKYELPMFKEPASSYAFILYNDKETDVETIISELEAKGISTYFWKRDVPAGVPWKEFESQQLREARTVLVFLGDSGWGPNHLQIAQEAQRLDKPLIPILMGNPPQEDFDKADGLFRNRRYLDLRKVTPYEIDRVVNEVLLSILAGHQSEEVDEALRGQIEDFEDRSALAESQSEAVHSVPDSIFQKTYPSYIPDRAAYGRRALEAPLDDALGVGVHAGHLAQLIAAKETWMPLSIGLFGAWGSGKSHFIDLLDENLRTITHDPGEVFHKHIVQIRFNAWHYLDTNLWASLVCEIFDQLFVKLDGSRATPAQVEKLKDELTKQSALATEAKEALKIAEKVRVDAEEKLRTAMKERIVEENKVGALLDDLKILVLDEEVKKQLRVAAEGLGLPKLQNSFAELEARAAEVRSLSGRAKALALAIFTGPGWCKRGLLLVIALAAPLGVAWLANHGPFQQLLAGMGRTIAQLVTAIAALSAWISTQAKAGNSLVAKLESAYDEVKKVRAVRESEDDAAKAQKALAAKLQAEEEARHTLREAEEKMKAIRAEIAELAPGRQLMRFLKDRASAEDYRQHLGLVSLVRRDFEQLSNLLTKAGKEEDPTLPQIDRIVLYIDDLDRCRADRVIEVLEAVHLLLAFPLFAVVVAVDPRWLRQSLLDHYPRLLGGAEDSDNRLGTRNLGRPATPQDYLEKIFQLPFNLQSLEKTGYEALIHQLFPIADTAPKFAESEQAAQSSLPVNIPSTAESPIVSKPTVVVGGIPQPMTSSPGVAIPIEEIAKTQSKIPLPDPQRLTLTKKEVADIQCFHPLFQTPRAVKRLANTYCLIRVGVDEENWKAYLGPGDVHGIYRLPMLLLAVTSAFPSLSTHWLPWLLEKQPTQWVLTEEEVESLATKHAGTTEKVDWNRLSHALGVLDLQDWPLPESNALEAWVPRVSLYSF